MNKITNADDDDAMESHAMTKHRPKLWLQLHKVKLFLTLIYNHSHEDFFKLSSRFYIIIESIYFKSEHVKKRNVRRTIKTELKQKYNRFMKMNSELLVV